MSQPTFEPIDNPYVGPRTFSEAERSLFFGREREARDLTARLVSERLLLFYAQSGAGKSSLLNTRVIPRLRDEEGFQVLPVGRVSGELPAGVDATVNLYVFNLMTSLDQSGEPPARLAGLTLSEFLARLAGETVGAADGQRTRRWVYKPDAAVERPTVATEPAARTEPRFVLIIDQFEEIITSHPGRWEEREAFFRQLNQALADDPTLWVVLTLREDYVASLDPYAPLLFNRLRARFYMERMSVDAALDAIRRPAELGGRPFASGVAERLAEDLRQVRVLGQRDTVSGQYVEPVQLQVVCYQLWDNIKGRPLGPITAEDLAEAGDVNQALSRFYERTLQDVLADPATQGVSERQLRAWFDGELITEAGTRGLVRQEEQETGGLPNASVRALQSRFVVRSETRSGDTWIELVHDRLIAPVQASNATWFAANLSTLQRQATLWDEQRRSSGLLLRDAALTEAETWAASHATELQAGEQEFLVACREAQAANELEHRQSRRIRQFAFAAVVLSILALAAFAWSFYLRAQGEFLRSLGESLRRQGDAAQREAFVARSTAVASEALAREHLERLAGLALLQEAYALKAQGDAQGAIEKFRAAQATKTDLGIDVEVEIEDVRRKVATDLVWQGETLAKGGDYPAAEARFKAALALEPPPDTPVYVYVPAGEFRMGAGAEDDRIAVQFGWDNSSERPQHPVTLDGYWIQRTEVTNAQYARCVKDRGCKPPFDRNIRYYNPQFAKQPVTGITWDQAQAYAKWVGGRLPTEAEWEKACRGGLEIPQDPLVGWGQMKRNDQVERPYPWGNQDPTEERLNFDGTGLGTWSAVGSYPKGASPYGALDMAGNVWEWTADWLDSKYYADSPKENPTGPATGDFRVLRGGSFYYAADLVRCAKRDHDYPGNWFDRPGFRVVVFPDF